MGDPSKVDNNCQLFTCYSVLSTFTSDCLRIIRFEGDGFVQPQEECVMEFVMSFKKYLEF